MHQMNWADYILMFAGILEGVIGLLLVLRAQKPNQKNRKSQILFGSTFFILGILNTLRWLVFG